MISVIIATLNRADALKDISLPSLLRQDTADFEVIVWDASQDNASKNVCDELTPLFMSKNISLGYHKAPRKGSASQRNDAVSVASGEIIFFIDDDCEVSVDSISALKNCFTSFPWLYGAGIPLLNKTPASGNSRILQFAARLFGVRNNCLKRTINAAGGLSLPQKDLPGTAEWLSGGAMAYRKSVFGKVRFDERLELFGGYALGEDVDFSHRIMLEFAEPLLIANGGYVIHHAATQGNRGVGANKVAAHFFNPEITRRNFAQYGTRYNSVNIFWSKIGTLLFLLKTGTKVCNLREGISLARMKLKER